MTSKPEHEVIVLQKIVESIDSVANHEILNIRASFWSDLALDPDFPPTGRPYANPYQ